MSRPSGTHCSPLSAPREIQERRFKERGGDTTQPDSWVRNTAATRRERGKERNIERSTKAKVLNAADGTRDRIFPSHSILLRARVFKKRCAHSHPKRYLIHKDKKSRTERFECATRWPLTDPFAVKKEVALVRYFQPANESRIPSRKHVPRASPRGRCTRAQTKKSAKHTSEEEESRFG